MRKVIVIVTSWLFFSCNQATPSREGEKATTDTLTLTEVCSGIEAPIGVVNAGDGTNRLFIIEQGGKIRVVKESKLLAEPFLDISSKLDKMSGSYSEKGLLGLAFNPQYKTNGKFYIYYSAPASNDGMDHTSVVAEYSVSSNPDVANTTEKTLLRIDEPESNHNGGQLAFGKDGCLYIGVGDGGGAGDDHGKTGNAQNLNTLLGKILRISINPEAGYSIPTDNPFVNHEGKHEIWAYGLRNPWRFSFDRLTGDLYCGDVGQDKYEEVNIIEIGANYGWRIMEGEHCYNPSSGCSSNGLALPINEYDHSVGQCVIGGYVYRGQKNKSIQGKYIFADWTGPIFMLEEEQGEPTWERQQLPVSPSIGRFFINSFGEDENGELYICGQPEVGTRVPGKLYRVDFR